MTSKYIPVFRAGGQRCRRKKGFQIFQIQEHQYMLMNSGLGSPGESWDNRVPPKTEEGSCVNKHGCIKQFSVEEYEKATVCRYADEEGICGSLRERVAECIYGGEIINITVTIVTRLVVLKHHMPDTAFRLLCSLNIGGRESHKKMEGRERGMQPKEASLHQQR